MNFLLESKNEMHPVAQRPAWRARMTSTLTPSRPTDLPRPILGATSAGASRDAAVPAAGRFDRRFVVGAILRRRLAGRAGLARRASCRRSRPAIQARSSDRKDYG